MPTRRGTRERVKWVPVRSPKSSDRFETKRGVDLTGWELEEPRSEPQPYFAGISFSQ